MRASVPDIDTPDLSAGFESTLRHFVRSAAAAFAGPEWSQIFPAAVALRTSMPELDEFIEIDKAEKLQMLTEIIDVGISEGLLPKSIEADVAAHVLIGPPRVRGDHAHP